MSLREFNRVFAPDNQINHQDNWLSACYKRSRAIKLFVHFILLVGVSWFSEFAVTNGKSIEFSNQFPAKQNIEGASLVLIWLSTVMLLHLYIYRRRCFYWSLPPGLLWLPMGDLLAAPYWMALGGYVLAVLLRFKAFTTLLLPLLILTSIAYQDIYQSTSHSNFLFLLGGWLILALRMEKKLAQRQQEALPQQNPWDDGNSPVKAKQEEQVREAAARATAAPLQPTLTEAQQPFAAFWLELNTLRKQPPLPAQLQSEVDELMRYAERILECMQEDPNYVKPGSVFLERYLPQVTTVVKRGLSLSGKLKSHGKTDEIEQQCFDALKALNSAFSQQHLRLLENDTLEFETDLTVLNSLLKTDGFKQ